MGAAFEVYNVQGYGLLEEIYQESLEIELELRGIPYKSKQELTVFYKNRQLKKRYVYNIIEKSIRQFVEKFQKQKEGARILIKKVEDPQRFGVVEFEKGKILNIAEKPKRPKTDYIVTGIYMYDYKVFDIIRRLKPSKRRELEITDVNNAYIRKGLMHYDKLPGFWTDSGTFESLLRANNLAASKCKGNVYW